MQAGTILFHRDFEFADGTSAHKFLIVLGGNEQHLVVVKTTSKGERYRNDHGCQAGNRFAAFLLTRGCCCLPLNTWICLGDFYELTLEGLNQRLVGGQLRRYGLLTNELTRDVQFCALNCDDISSAQAATVQTSLVEV